MTRTRGQADLRIICPSLNDLSPRSDIGALEPGKCGDFFTLDLTVIGYAGGLSDPVAAVVFCAPQPARYTVVGGRCIVADGRIATLAIEPVIEKHNRHVRNCSRSKLGRGSVALRWLLG